MGLAPCEGVQPDRGTLAHDHEVARRSVRAVSRIMNDIRNPSDIFFTLYVGLHGPGWLYIRARNASPWLLAIFRDFEPTDHVPRSSARAHCCAVVFGRGSLRAPEPRAREKTRG